MRRWALLCALLTACAGERIAPKALPTLASPEADPTAPGMIASNCESLLRKSEEWKFTPEQKWQPSSETQALEVLHFFDHFHMVPEASAKFYQSWLEASPPKNEEEAKKSLEDFSTAQSCDPSLAMSFLLPVIRYPFAKEKKAEVSQSILRFLLNQQARIAPLLVRAVSVDVLEQAQKRGFLKGSSASARSLLRSLHTESSGETAPALESWKNLRKEFALSEDVRVRLSRVLPLP